MNEPHAEQIIQYQQVEGSDYEGKTQTVKVTLPLYLIKRYVIETHLLLN